VRTKAILSLPPLAGRSGSLLVTAAVVALAVSGLPSADAAIAAPVVTLAGSLGTLPAGTATVVVRAELALNVNSRGVPQELDDVPVASATITSRAFSIPVPDSATLQKAEAQRNGFVNFNILVTSGTSQTSEYVPVALAVWSATTHPVELTAQYSHQVEVPAFPAFRTVNAAHVGEAVEAPDNGPSCAWYAYGKMYQESTRVGEVHVANVPGVSDTFWFKNQNDMTVSVGLSNTGPNSGYSYDGTIQLTNSLSANGSDTFGPGSVEYIDDTTNYQRYELESDGHSCRQYMVQAVGSDADVYPGTGTPPRNPWGSCRNDPLHVTLAPGATWSRDQSSAAYYGSIASLFGFTFGGSDGFTTNVEHDYSALHAKQTTYICGDAKGEAPTQAPILYNTP
jgi:hypothetical protein